jgi:hypothetical protein
MASVPPLIPQKTTANRRASALGRLQAREGTAEGEVGGELTLEIMVEQVWQRSKVCGRSASLDMVLNWLVVHVGQVGVAGCLRTSASAVNSDQRPPAHPGYLLCPLRRPRQGKLHVTELEGRLSYLLVTVEIQSAARSQDSFWRRSMSSALSY